MIRRRFLGLMTSAAGATSLTALTRASLATGGRETVVYKVTGFTCITCATGLETLLGRERGVVAVKATYPEGITTVTYGVRSTTREEIRTAIESMGFSVHELERKCS